jgi:Right handed beta helix region
MLGDAQAAVWRDGALSRHWSPRSLRRSVLTLALALSAILVALPAPARAGTRETGPEEDWCAAARLLEPGDELLLGPGEYAGPCTLTRSGAPGSPIVIRGRDPADPPRIVQLRGNADALGIQASYLTLRGLEFGPTLIDVDAVRIFAGTGITIEQCRFAEIGGIAIAATHADLSDILIRQNDISRTRWTAIYVGCHDGRKCRHTGIVIERNYIREVGAPDQGPAGDPGAGIQIKLNSTATIRDNVIVQTRGPAVAVYGARDLTRLTLVERNFVYSSLVESGIWLGGGPAIVRNNVAVASAEGGIELQDYARRGLLRGIVIVHNTVHGNPAGGIMVPLAGLVQATIVNNAVHTRVGTPAVPVGRAGVLSLGNATCTLVPCFVDPQDRDFSPLAARPGLTLGQSWMPSDDYFGRPRRVPPTVGAIEQPGGPIPLGLKAEPP